MAAGKVLMLVENEAVPKDWRVWLEALALRDNGFQVSIICPRNEPPYQESYTCLDGIFIYRYSAPASSGTPLNYIVEYSVSLCFIFLLTFKIWWRHGFDIIHAANPPDLFFPIGLFYRLFGKKFVFDQHDLSPELFLIKSGGRIRWIYRMLRFLEWCSYRTAHRVIVANASFRELALKRGGVPADRIFVVRNGPHITVTGPIKPALELRKGFPYLLAYAGVMSRQDGVEYALLALHRLVHERGRHDVLLALIGDGDALDELKALAHQLQLDEYVMFTGWVERSEVVRYLGSADIGLTPDPQNGLNEYSTMIKVLDYMLLRRPVVAFDLTENRYSAGDAALYARPNDVRDFAAKVEILLEDAALRERMGNVGHRRIIEMLDWSHSQPLLLQAYETLQPGRGPHIAASTHKN